MQKRKDLGKSLQRLLECSPAQLAGASLCLSQAIWGGAVKTNYATPVREVSCGKEQVTTVWFQFYLKRTLLCLDSGVPKRYVKWGVQVKRLGRAPACFCDYQTVLRNMWNPCLEGWSETLNSPSVCTSSRRQLSPHLWNPSLMTFSHTSETSSPWLVIGGRNGVIVISPGSCWVSPVSITAEAQ